jgi:predicted nucleotidyltransferase
MNELKISAKIKRNIQDFMQGLKDIYQEGLISIILYGSAASGEFVNKQSNLNLLVVLKDTDLENLKKSIGLVKRFGMFNPLFLTEDYIHQSTDIFPIEFLDMKENYRILYGKDVLSVLNIDSSNLRFQCEQELKAKLLNLRQIYLAIHKDNTSLRSLLLKSFTSVLHILRNVLRLKGKAPVYRKEDILKDIALEFPVDIAIWRRILSVKNERLRLSGKETEDLFFGFTRDLEKIVEIVDKL